MIVKNLHITLWKMIIAPFKKLLEVFSSWIIILCTVALVTFPCISKASKADKTFSVSSVVQVDSTKEKKSLNSTADLFTKLSTAETGIDFSNTIEETPEFSYLTYPHMLNGGGVAVGDINNDGLPDIFLTGNMVSSRLYLNEGDMRFRDITEMAGVDTERWITGVSMVDINNDGHIDIYLSAASPEGVPAEKRANLLFINNGDNTFTEMAEEYNIADKSHSTDALFLDYNKDGLLDLFLLNHTRGTFLRDKRGQESSVSSIYDKIYKNSGDSTFTEVSEEAGIVNEQPGYGLGAVSADFNNDGWPDIYVSNDIGINDRLYINNQNGTFSNRSKDYLKHTSYAGMGLDISDFNNDGWPDIMQVDMKPEDYQNRKLMSYGRTFARYINKIILGSNYQYNKNSLQLNNGLDAEGKVVFSEIARIAGVAYTGWSWSSLFGDYNNDGMKDIIITNGYPKAITDYDYLNAQYDGEGKPGSDKQSYQLYEELRNKKIPNYIFKNKKKLRFEDVSQEWGFQDSTYSYGIAHADLDNDGDLDLVINNLNSTASIYQNNNRELTGNHYLLISLQGPQGNKKGMGAKIVVTAGKQKQYKYQTIYRGYQSSQDPRIHFGFAKISRIDSIEVFWPDGKYQLLKKIEADQQISIDYTEVSDRPSDTVPVSEPESRPFKNITQNVDLQHKHQENKFNDYQIQPLLWRQLSRMGPKIAVGDVDGDGLEDVFIGGAAGNPGTLYLQSENGSFVKFNDNQPWLIDETSEDMGAVFFDANGDKHPDLYVASGGYEFSPAADAILDRLYINTGDGRFIKDKTALPRMYTSSSQVVPGDFNADGQIDLFVGGRLVPYKYPLPAKSYILKNENGKFKDVTKEIASELVEPGLITDALWTDFNEDGEQDLVTAGVWLPVQFYENKGGTFREVTDSVLKKAPTGWWYSLEKGDFNNDGSTDIIAGNAGHNHTFSTSEEKKFGVIADDLNSDLTTDIIHTVSEGGIRYPFFGKARLMRGFKSLNTQYETFESFSGESVRDIFDFNKLEEALYYEADTFASTLFLSNGEGRFSLRPLPEKAQVFPIKAIIPYDVNQDGNLDLISGGNIFATHPNMARVDGGNGLWMLGNGKGEFEPVSATKSGLYAPRDVKDMKLITTSAGKALIIANNDGPVQLFDID